MNKIKKFWIGAFFSSITLPLIGISASCGQSQEVDKDKQNKLLTLQTSLKTLLATKDIQINLYSDPDYDFIKDALETAYDNGVKVKTSDDLQQLKEARQAIELAIAKAVKDKDFIDQRKTAKQNELIASKNELKTILDSQLAQIAKYLDDEYAQIKADLIATYNQVKELLNSNDIQTIQQARETLEQAILKAESDKQAILNEKESQRNLVNQARNTLIELIKVVDAQIAELNAEKYNQIRHELTEANNQAKLKSDLQDISELQAATLQLQIAINKARNDKQTKDGSNNSTSN
ncbi:hypothetical protein [Mycoplasma nasistruthionis]|uniref:Lipoprotein n=1 Tax=Mycoplasma nasistruthionis TaxID=353852 RepID=A0A5B7XUA5_9MOLU|nr:hypothetical protein [Mycoplasma nasistruthionis]QCZ36441.1 hypothetical protein FG904_00150 [Mycoplasma nasistruthionis]